MTKEIQTATPEQLAALREPAAIAAFELARKNKWLSVDEVSLNTVFANDPAHPVREMLADDAAVGGSLGILQYIILSVFFGLAFGMTIFTHTIPPMLFVMWGALGVAAALLSRKHSKLIFGKFSLK